MFERVLIIGHGNVGKRHLSLVRESLPEADIRVLRHSVEGVVPELANGCFYSLSDACDFLPQVSVVANPAPFHAEAALALLQVGSHVLLEKPLAHESESVKDLLSAEKKYQRVLQIGYNLRFLASLRKFREIIHSGAVGRVLSVRCEVGQYLPLWRPGSNYRNSVSAQKELGGGVLLELSHEIDYLRWTFGDVAWVSAWLGMQSALDIDTEDVAHLTLGFAPDEAGHSLVASVNLDFIRHDRTRFCTAIGEKGSIRWNGLSGELEEWFAGGVEWSPSFKCDHHINNTYIDQWECFLDCIKQDRAPKITVADGYAVLRIIDAARKSDSSHYSRVDLEPYG